MKAETRASSKSEGHLAPLDGLRAFAILLVLLVHLTPGRDSNRGLEGAIFKLADIGWSGVDLFFVLSGFLITRILVASRGTATPFWVFFARRCLRIVPAYYLALFTVFMVVPLVTHAYDTPGYGSQFAYWFYVSNITPGSQSAEKWYDLSHFWSLAVEMQFYALWPLLVAGLNRQRLLAATAALLVVGLAGRTCAVLLELDPWVTFAWLPFRADGLLVGSFIGVWTTAEAKDRTALGVAVACVVTGGVIIAAVTWFGYASAALWRGSAAGPIYATLRIVLPFVLSLFYGAAVYLSIKSRMLGVLLGARLLQPLARYSYGIYIVHNLYRPTLEHRVWPYLLEWYGGSHDAALYSYFVLTSAASFAVAACLYHLWEAPFLKMKVALQ